MASTELRWRFLLLLLIVFCCQTLSRIGVFQRPSPLIGVRACVRPLSTGANIKKWVVLIENSWMLSRTNIKARPPPQPRAAYGPYGPTPCCFSTCLLRVCCFLTAPELRQSIGRGFCFCLLLVVSSCVVGVPKGADGNEIRQVHFTARSRYFK